MGYNQTMTETEGNKNTEPRDHIKTPKELYAMLETEGAENVSFSSSEETAKDGNSVITVFNKMMILHNEEKNENYIVFHFPKEEGAMLPTLMIADFGSNKNMQRLVTFKNNLNGPYTYNMEYKKEGATVNRKMDGKEISSFLSDVGISKIDKKATREDTIAVDNFAPR